jgi:hypothetical protein
MFLFLSFLSTGLLMNTLAAENPPKTFDDVKDAIQHEIDEVKAREGFVSYKLND